MEMVFLIAVIISAMVGLVLLGFAIYKVMQRADGEISGFQLRGSLRRMSAVAYACISETVNVRLALILLACMMFAVGAVALIAAENQAAWVRFASYGAFLLILLGLPFFILMRLGKIRGGAQTRAGRTVTLTTIMVGVPLLIAVFGTGDGTIKGRIQMFLNYVPAFTSFALAGLTLVVSTRSLTAEIKGKQIFSLAAKPIPRWQIVGGKWLGVTLLNAAILGFATLSTWLGARYIMWTFHRQMQSELVDRGGLTEDQAARCVDAINNVRGPGAIGVDSPIVPAISEALGWDDESGGDDPNERYRRTLDLLLKLPETTRANLRHVDEVRRQVLVARAAIVPEPPDVSEAVEQQYKRMESQNALPDLMTKHRVLEELTKIMQAAARTIPPNTGRLWKLKGPPPTNDPGFLMSVRYKLEGYAPAMQFPEMNLNLEEERFLSEWWVGENSQNGYHWPPAPETRKQNAWAEFEVPSHVVSSDGQIELRFLNRDPRHLDATFAVDGLEVLYSAGTFGGNLLRAWLTMMLPLMLLAAMGVFFATFCTFPVALLVTLVLYLSGISSGFLAESIGITTDVFPEYPTNFDEFRRAVGQLTLSALTISSIDVSDRLVEGRLLDWRSVWHEALMTVFIRGAIFMVLAIYIFKRRELAAIIV